MSDTDIKKFKVIPGVPKQLKGLYDIAYNLWLYWNPDAIKLFIRMDDRLWDKTKLNPVKMLGEISQERLDELAKDEAYVLEVERYKKNRKIISNNSIPKQKMKKPVSPTSPWNTVWRSPSPFIPAVWEYWLEIISRLPVMRTSPGGHRIALSIRLFPPVSQSRRMAAGFLRCQ